MADDSASRRTGGCTARSQLFTVRVWVESLGDGRSEWRGKVQHVLGGEAAYFRDWPTLITFLSHWLECGQDADAPRP